MKIKLTEITIPKDRFERDISNTDGLKESLERLNRVIHPIVLNEDAELIAGNRRLTFAKELGWEDIDYVLFEGLSKEEQRIIELEENVRRKDLSWQEKARARVVLAELYEEIYGKAKDGNPHGEKVGLNVTEIGAKMGISGKTLSQSKRVMEALDKHPEIKALSSESQALSAVKRKELMEIRAILAYRASDDIKSSIIQGDCLEIMKGMKDGSVNMVLTDIPYGAGFGDDTIAQGYMSQDEATAFDDDFMGSLKTVFDVRDELFRVMAEGSHMYMFTGLELFIPVRNHYREKFRVRSMPIVWDKVVQGYTNEPDLVWTNRYELLMFASKGTREFVYKGELDPSRGDIIRYHKVPSAHKKHKAHKPKELGRGLILLSTLEGEVVLDPFCGCAEMLKAGLALKRKIIGIDNNKDTVAIARENLSTHQEFLVKERGFGEDEEV